MGIEFERKFRADPDTLAAIRSTYNGHEQLLSMETTYYDTPSGDLTARKYTLRRRLENGTSVCALKTSAGAEGRGEYEVRCDSIEAAVPELCKLFGSQELQDLVRPGLVSICGARFTRIAKTLVLPECTAELALDNGVLTGGGRQCPLCEVEVELKAGSREALCAFAAQLAEAFRLEPEPQSKFRRARNLAEGG